MNYLSRDDYGATGRSVPAPVGDNQEGSTAASIGNSASFQMPQTGTSQSAGPTRAGPSTVYFDPRRYKLVPGHDEDGEPRLMWTEVPGYAQRRPFAGVWRALLPHNELLLKITTEYMTPHQLFDLYCIDRDFNEIVDNHLTTWMKATIRRWAPLKRPIDAAAAREAEANETITAMHVFPFSCYRSLCVPDPAHRTTVVPIPASAAASNGSSRTTGENVATVRRWVPSFKYLFFLIHRNRTVRSILRTMVWDHDVRFPEYMAVTLGKIWFLMDVPNNGMRLAIIHNRQYFTDNDLRRAYHFLVKLDMVFSNPLDPQPYPALRKLMLAQKSLEPLDELLLRCTFRSVNAAGKQSARLKSSFWSPRAEPQERESLLYERYGSGWRRTSTGWYRFDPATGRMHFRSLLRLLQPDHLIIMEGLRRRLGLHKQVLSMLRSGYRPAFPYNFTARIKRPQWWLDRNERMKENDFDRLGTGYKLPPAPMPNEPTWIEPHPLTINGMLYFFWEKGQHEAVDFNKRYVVTEQEYQISLAEQRGVARGAEGSLRSPVMANLTQTQQKAAETIADMLVAAVIAAQQ